MLPRGALLTVATSARLALGSVLLLALGLRLWGLSFGLPYVIQPDEPSVEGRALAMWLNGDPNPHYFVYPSLYYDMQALWALSVGHIAGLFAPDILRHPLAHQPVYYYAGRLLTAVLGTLAVLTTYLTGCLLDRKVGLVAGLFLAVAVQHVEQSHYITVDAPTALFTVLTAYFALRTVGHQGHGLDFYLSGIAAGLAAGIKYNAGVAVAMSIVAVLLCGTRSWRWRVRAAVGTALVAVVAFLITTPYAVLDTRTFLAHLHGVTVHYGEGHPGAEGSWNALWYVGYLARQGMGVPLTLLALGGVAVFVVRHRARDLVLLAFVIPYYALLCATYVRFDRNLLPLLPFLALLAAAAADALVPRLARVLRNHGAAYLAVIGVAAGASAYGAARGDFSITHPFSEQVAVTWADGHLPAGATVAIENWEGRAFALSSLHYRVTPLPSLASKTYSWFRARGIHYLVADSWTDGAYLSNPARYPVQVARYRALFRGARLLRTIASDPLLRPGPTMTIYQVY